MWARFSHKYSLLEQYLVTQNVDLDDFDLDLGMPDVLYSFFSFCLSDNDGVMSAGLVSDIMLAW